MNKPVVVLLVIIAFLSGTLITLYAVEAPESNLITGRTIYSGNAQNYEEIDPVEELIIEKDAKPTDVKPEHTEKSLFGIRNNEKPSPYDRIKEEQILVYKDRIIIDIADAEWSKFTDTNSMDPVIDEGANALQIVPKNPGEIHVGDIISYDSSNIDGTVIHRVVNIDQDVDGWYCIAKGDNSNSNDPERIRFNQIQRVVIGIIY